MCDYFEFAAGLGWTKVFGNGGRFGPGIPRDTPPVSPRGGETSTGVDSAGPILCNTVRSHPIPSDPTRSQNFLPDPASSRSSPSFDPSRRAARLAVDCTLRQLNSGVVAPLGVPDRSLCESRD